MINWNPSTLKRTLLAGALAGFIGYAGGTAYSTAYADASCGGGLRPKCRVCLDDCEKACDGGSSCDCPVNDQGDPDCTEECTYEDNCET
jgi:hypothetical protein